MSRRNSRNRSQSSSSSLSVLGKLSPDQISRSVSSLVGSTDTDPDPRAYSQSKAQTTSRSVDVTRPDKSIEAFYNEYEKNPIIGTEVHAFAEAVFEAGWWLTADSERTRTEMEEFCQNIGIQSGKPHQNLSTLGETAIIQNQIRGSFLGETVTDNKGRHVALNPVNPSTVEVYTKPGVNILVPPDHESTASDSTVKRTEGGDAAAFVQFDRRLSRWSDRKERKFTRDQILHWPRRPDIGDIYGNSVVEPIFERSQALREKLQDNDLAIAMKAWPMILFELGEPDRPWSLDAITDFMDDYSEEELGPGMYQGVPGDVEVNEFAGETADIEEHVMIDVNMIVSAMPGPKHALGSFGGEAELTHSHQNQFQKTVRSTRKDVANFFTPYLRDVAQSWGLDPSGLELHVGRPDGQVAPEDINGSTIRYQSDVNNDDDDDADPFPDDDTDNGRPTGEQPSEQSQLSDSGNVNSPVSSDRYVQLADPQNSFSLQPSVATLQSRTDTSDAESAIRDLITTLLLDARDQTIDTLENKYSASVVPNGSDIEDEFTTTVARDARYGGLHSDITSACATVSDETLKTINTELEGSFSRPQTEQLIGRTVESCIRDIVDIGNEMGAEARRQTDVIADTERGVDAIVTRLLDAYDDATVEQRAWVIARMRTRELCNKLKYAEYKQHATITGYYVESSCSDSTHAVTAEIAGCDGTTPAEVSFDDDRAPGAQFQTAIDAEPSSGFDPLPDVPPFHFGSLAEIRPVVNENI